MSATTNKRNLLRRLVPAGIAALLIVGVTAGAGAQPNDHEPTFTGCLRTAGTGEGQLAAIRNGQSPSRPCGANEQPIRLSAGDITSVAAGTGLRTASGLGAVDTEGSVELDLAPAYRLPQQACFEGQMVTRQGTGWKCTTPPSATTVDVIEGRGRPAGGKAEDIVGDDWSTIAHGLDLPAGSWAIQAHVALGGTAAGKNSYASCRLDTTNRQFLDDVTLFSDDAGTFGTLSLSAAVTYDRAFRASVICLDQGEDAVWKNLRITATRATGTTTVDL